MPTHSGKRSPPPSRMLELPAASRDGRHRGNPVGPRLCSAAEPRANRGCADANAPEAPTNGSTSDRSTSKASTNASTSKPSTDGSTPEAPTDGSTSKATATKSASSEATTLRKGPIREHGRQYQGRRSGKPKPFHGRLLYMIYQPLSMTSTPAPD